MRNYGSVGALNVELSLTNYPIQKESQRQKEARRKQVKVMLLGQAESGKSTLQKQFQLYYASQTLDKERPSWKPIVHFNIIKAVKTMLDEIDYELSQPADGFEQDDDDEPQAGPSSSLSNSRPKPKEDEPQQLIRPSALESQTLSVLRTRLLPLIALHDSLASELSGGVSFSRGLTGVFVRAGWQGLLQTNRGAGGKAGVGVVAALAAKALDTAREDIEALWVHGVVRQMVKLRKLRLEESAPL